MNLKQTALAASVMTALVASNGASALVAIDTSNKLTGAVTLAKEEPINISETKSTVYSVSDSLAIQIPSIAGYPVKAASPLFFKFYLTGGAFFNKAPTLKCGTANGTNGVVGTRTQGGSGQNFVTFSIPNDAVMATNAASAICIMKVPGAPASATVTAYFDLVGKTDKGVSALIEHVIALNSKTAIYNGTFITFADTFSKTIQAESKALATNTTKLDVVEGAKLFDSKTTIGSSTKKAHLGYVKVNPASSIPRLRGKTAATWGFSGVIQTAFIDVTGPFNGAESIYLNTSSGCGGSSYATVSNPTGTTVSLTLKNTTEFNQLKANGLHVCMDLNGITPMNAGQFQAQIRVTPKTNWTLNFGDIANIHNLKKNGASFRALIVPSPKDASGKPALETSSVRLTNPNSFPVAVYGTLIGADGVQIGSTTMLDKLGSGGTLPSPLTSVPAYSVRLITLEDIAALFGKDQWQGRARLFIEAEAGNFFVQSLIRGSNGILTNMSSETKQD